MQNTILIIDDEKKLNDLLSRIISLEGFALRDSPERSKVIISIIHHNGGLAISVKNTGKGIDEQYQKRLFDRYFQAPTDGQNKSGSGLWLAISKDFIEAQNGQIWVESAIGEGSTFSFSLPGILCNNS